MPFKCDKCGKDATIQITEIEDGQKIEKHLCEDCAVLEGVTVKAQVPLMKLLEGMLLQSSSERQIHQLTCDVCGITFDEFRRQGLLGCPNDYEAFEQVLTPLLLRAHDGGVQHVGKTPVNAAASQRRQSELLRLRGQLKDAVAGENYEEAAALRDRIKELEGS